MRRTLAIVASVILLALAVAVSLATRPNAAGTGSSHAPAAVAGAETCGEGAECIPTFLPVTVDGRSSATPQPSATPTEPPQAAVCAIANVGAGYTDVSPKQLVRTSGDRLYVFASNCDSYPCDAVSQTLRAYRADRTGVPGGFSRMSAANEPAGVAQWAVALDGSDLIHVVYTRRTTNAGEITAVRYVTFDPATDTWGAPEDIDAGAFGYSSGQGDQTVGLALDGGGKPHAVYLRSDGTRRRMVYRNRVSGSWSAAELVDDQPFASNEKIWHPNIVFDRAGRRVYAFVKGTFNDAPDGEVFVRVRETSGAWNATANVSGENAALTSIDQSTSMVITPDNRYHITWINASPVPMQKVIRYAYSENQGGAWTRNDPASGTQATHNPSLGLAGGRLRIYGHGTPNAGNHGQHLYYFEGDGGAAAWGGWTQIVAGTNYDSSVNTRWAQYFFNSPTTVDIAFWNDIYPNDLYVFSAINGSQQADCPQ
jgi:hypothetical protein